MSARLLEVLRYVGVAMLVVAGFLAFGILAVAMRPLLILLLITAAIVAVIQYRRSPAFREWFDAAGEEQVTYNGLHLAQDVAIHPHHSWARIGRQRATVGADDLIQTTLGPVEKVEFPPIGAHLKQGNPLFSLRRGDRRVDVTAPVTGVVVATNAAVEDEPGLVNEDPFGRGWAVQMAVDPQEDSDRELLRGKTARVWFRQEIDRLLSMVLSGEHAAAALPDGGVLVRDVYREIDDQSWRRLTEEFFATAEGH